MDVSIEGRTKGNVDKPRMKGEDNTDAPYRLSLLYPVKETQLIIQSFNEGQQNTNFFAILLFEFGSAMSS